MRVTSCLTLGLCCLSLVASDPAPVQPISGPATFKRVALFDVDPDALLLLNKEPDEAKVTVLREAVPGKWVVAGDPGTYTFDGTALYFDWDSAKNKVKVKKIPVKFDFMIQGSPPPVPPPTPPGPNPPGPTPDGTSPFPDAGLRVLMVTETADEGKYTAGQMAVMYGTKVRDFLNANCVKVNGQPEYRIYDKDQNVTNDAKVWQDAMKRPRTATPWVLIGNGKTGYEGPLPASTSEAIDPASGLFTKYITK